MKLLNCGLDRFETEHFRFCCCIVLNIRYCPSLGGQRKLSFSRTIHQIQSQKQYVEHKSGSHSRLLQMFPLQQSHTTQEERIKGSIPLSYVKFLRHAYQPIDTQTHTQAPANTLTLHTDKQPTTQSQKPSSGVNQGKYFGLDPRKQGLETNPHREPLFLTCFSVHCYILTIHHSAFVSGRYLQDQLRPAKGGRGGLD